MADFDPTALLSKRGAEVEKPKPMAAGSYLFQVKSREFGKEENEKKTPFVLYLVTPIEPLPDVDQEKLAEALNGNPLSSKELRHKIYLTPDSLFRAKDFAIHCGLSEEDANAQTMGENVEFPVGKNFVGKVGHTISKKDPTQVFANIEETGPVPA